MRKRCNINDFCYLDTCAMDRSDSGLTDKATNQNNITSVIARAQAEAI